MNPKQQLRAVLDRLRAQLLARLPPIAGSGGYHDAAATKIDLGELAAVAGIAADLARAEVDYASLPDDPTEPTS